MPSNTDKKHKTEKWLINNCLCVRMGHLHSPLCSEWYHSIMEEGRRMYLLMISKGQNFRSYI